MTLELLFRWVFWIAILILELMGIGFFLLALKVMLLFSPQISIFGMTVSY